jgi:hypothetical protein
VSSTDVIITLLFTHKFPFDRLYFTLRISLKVGLYVVIGILRNLAASVDENAIGILDLVLNKPFQRRGEL